jgi:ribose/xylose/arabinose/galactoside ABC-type transport system permease subunit
VAGVVHAAYNFQGDPAGGVAYELNAIAAAVIGGCSLAGGQGSVIGTLIGANIFCVVLNGLPLIIAVNASLWEGIVVGTVVIGAVTFNVLRQRRGA